MMKRHLIPVLLFTALFAACTKDQPQQEAAKPGAQAPGAAATAVPAEGGEGGPIAGISIEPREPRTGESVRAVVDDEQGRVLQFVWSVDGEEVERGMDDQLSGSYLKKGGKITVSAAPVTEDGLGESVESDEVTVVNTAPRVSGIEFVTSDDELIVLQARAEDIDFDPLQYRIIYGPEGMAINADGLIQWPVPAEFADEVTFTVGVSDGEKEFQLESQIGKR